MIFILAAKCACRAIRAGLSPTLLALCLAVLDERAPILQAVLAMLRKDPLHRFLLWLCSLALTIDVSLDGRRLLPPHHARELSHQLSAGAGLAWLATGLRGRARAKLSAGRS